MKVLKAHHVQMVLGLIECNTEYQSLACICLQSTDRY